jgi:hypothetical protein
MIIMNAPRQSGKTSWAIRQAHKHNAIIVTRTNAEGYRLQEHAKLIGFPIQKPLHFERFLELLYRGEHHSAPKRRHDDAKNIYIIDELSMCLEARGVKIYAVTDTAPTTEDQRL